MATGVLRAAVDRGLRVPEDLSVVGHDDQDFAPYQTPPLTSVNQDLAEVGRRSLKHLLKLIEGERGHKANPPARGHSSRSAGRPVRNLDRKSTRLNSSHVAISYAVFCLKKKRSRYHTTQ